MRFNTKMRLKSRPQYQKLNKYDKIQLAWFHKPHKNLPRSVQGTVVAASTQCHSQTSISWNTMKHSDSLHRVCFIHLYTAICAASRILSLIAWAIVKRWKEFGIKQVRICKTHSFSHWTRWIQTIVELSGTHFERVVRHIPCCFKMCQNMSTFFEHETYEKNWKDALNSPRLSALGPIVPILSALIVPPSPWILQTDREALNVGSFYFFTDLPDFFETKIVQLYDSYDTHIMTHMKSYDIYDQLAVTFTTWESETLNSECILQLGKRLASHELHTSLSLIPQHSVWNLQWASKDLAMLML